MLKFDVFQQRMGASFFSEGKVTEFDGELIHVDTVIANHGAEAIDIAKKRAPFQGWLPSRLEAYPVVGLA